MSNYLSFTGSEPLLSHGITLTVRFVFGKHSVRISSGIPAIPTQDYGRFHQPLQTNSRIVIQIGHDRFLPNLFQSIIRLLSRSAIYVLGSGSVVN
jgi:hypothetical protein